MSTTPNLAIAHILQSQNSKEVTANAAFDALDAAENSEFSHAMADANYTLATADALGNGVFVMTGTLTADRNVTVPNNKKRYVFANQTTGGHNIVVKTAAGTGVTLGASPAYKPMYCDGTNVVGIG